MDYVSSQERIKMKIAINLNDRGYIHDYMDMGVSLFMVGGEYSVLTPVHYSLEEIKEIRAQVKELYIYVNAMYDEHDLKGLKEYIEALHQIGVDGLIFQDFGVLNIVNHHDYSFKMIYHPLTLNTNSSTLNVLKQYGINGAVVSKEISLKEQLEIRKNCDMPLFVLGHGVQYMMMSKRHLISNYEKASHTSLSHEQGALTINPRGQDFPCHIYETDRGTAVFSKNKLYTLDLFHTLKDFDYLYIETMFMDQREAIEVISMYCDCLHALEKGTYDKEVKEYMPLLKNVSQPLDRGFLYDDTIYRIEDVKRRDNDAANQ